MKFSISGAGAIGPGFADWQEFCSLVDSNESDDSCVSIPPSPIPLSMSKRERARAPYLVKLAVAAAEQACAASGFSPGELAMVFSSSMSDTEVTDYMCRTLIENPSEMSPTKFHNSVHNAAAGYWAISNAVHKPATAISGSNQHSAALALVEAASQCDQDGSSVLLVVYDILCPPSFNCILDITSSLAFALVLTPVGRNSDIAPIVSLEMDANVDKAESDMISGTKKASGLSFQNPTADLLPLMQCLASDSMVDVTLPMSAARRLSVVRI